MEKIDDPLQNDFGTLSQKTGLNRFLKMLSVLLLSKHCHFKDIHVYENIFH